MKVNSGIQKLHDNTANAKTKLEECENDLNMARHNHTNALNHLNKCQKEFDEFIEEMKNKSPKSSDWGRKGEKVYVSE